MSDLEVAVTYAEHGLRCTVWGDPSCPNYARWTLQRRHPLNVTTRVVHACPQHLVDGAANLLDLSGAQRAMVDVLTVDRPLRIKDTTRENLRRLGRS